MPTRSPNDSSNDGAAPEVVLSYSTCEIAMYVSGILLSELACTTMFFMVSVHGNLSYIESLRTGRGSTVKVW